MIQTPEIKNLLKKAISDLEGKGYTDIRTYAYGTNPDMVWADVTDKTGNRYKVRYSFKSVELVF